MAGRVASFIAVCVSHHVCVCESPRLITMSLWDLVINHVSSQHVRHQVLTTCAPDYLYLSGVQFVKQVCPESHPLSLDHPVLLASIE